jgi:hypothetical protein
METIQCQFQVILIEGGAKILCPTATCHWFHVVKGKRTMPILRKLQAAVTEHLKEAHHLLPLARYK